MKLGVEQIAWRGFVTHEGDVIAWPTLLADHNDFHRTFMTSDEDFAARWRQWSPGEAIDVNPCANPEGARDTVSAWIREQQR